MTKEILNEQKKRDRLKKKWIKSGHISGSQEHIAYKTSRNLVLDMIRIAKKEKSFKSCVDAKGDSEKIWKVIRQAMNTKPKSNTTPDFIKVKTPDGNTKKIHDKIEIANEMNKRFCQMGANLAEKLPTTETNFSEFLQFPNPNHERFILHPVTEPEVDKEAQNLDISKTVGADEISPKIIKWSTALLTPILTKLFNMCLLGGIYPESLKIARVIPIFK